MNPRDLAPYVLGVISAGIAATALYRSTRLTVDATEDANNLATMTFWRENTKALEARVKELEARMHVLEGQLQEKDATIARLYSENQRLAARRAGQA